MKWNEELGRTGQCIAIERLNEPLSEAERAHLSTCSRCEAEMRLFREFEASETGADEAADVASIVTRLRPKRDGVLPFAPRRLSPFRALAAAAMVVLAVGLAYMVQKRVPSTNAPVGIESYRSARIELVTPNGDVQHAPTELRWVAVPGAELYDVRVFEVDRTILWRVSTSSPRVELPPAVIAQFVPGKTVLWHITARHGNAVAAESGMGTFRVVTH